jgi:hypothetical protein
MCSCEDVTPSFSGDIGPLTVIILAKYLSALANEDDKQFGKKYFSHVEVDDTVGEIIATYIVKQGLITA